jgi:hypothetical protein
MWNCKVRDGNQIWFLEDKWLGLTTIKDQYHNLYNIVRRKSVTVANIFSTRLFNVSFIRTLVAENLQSWHELVMRITNIHLNEQSDVFRWSLKSDGHFFMTSMYQALLDSDIILSLWFWHKYHLTHPFWDSERGSLKPLIVRWRLERGYCKRVHKNISRFRVFRAARA